MKPFVLFFDSKRLSILIGVILISSSILGQSFAVKTCDPTVSTQTNEVSKATNLQSVSSNERNNSQHSNTLYRAPASEWKYKRSISLNPATPQSDYQVKVELTTSNFDYSHAKSDGSDLRFYDGSDTQLSYWIENWNPSGTSTIWVKVPTASTNAIFMYYGNSSADAVSTGSVTFDFFDDFEDGNYDGWTSQKYEADDNLGMETVYPLQGSYSLKLHQGESWGYMKVWSPFIQNPDVFLKVKAKQTGYENMDYSSGMGIVVLYYDNAETLLKALVWPVYSLSNQNHEDWTDKAPSSERVDNWNLADSQVGERELNVSTYKPANAAKIKIKAIIHNVSFADFWVDLFRVRKYASSEPVSSLGIESDNLSTGLKNTSSSNGFSLFQNQPNPFSTGTLIRYELPEKSNVTLKVYDMFGREVVRLFEGEQNGGKYEVEFNGANLPGGIYFCQLQAGNFLAVRKLLLLK